MDQRDSADRTEPALAAEPIEKMDAAEPIEAVKPEEVEGRRPVSRAGPVSVLAVDHLDGYVGGATLVRCRSVCRWRDGDGWTAW
jgi:hypothetical protein